MSAIKRQKVFGVGLIALDLVVGQDPTVPVRCWAGGTCGNVLSILAFLGWDSYPVARMNSDVASNRVRADMSRWGVHLDFTDCAPTTHTPIIVQQILQGKDGRPKHRFSWSCPHCGEWLPSFKPITTAAIEKVKPALEGASVFFLDRLSRAALSLASEARAGGAVVVFEPSRIPSSKLTSEAIALSDIVKYSDERLAEVCDLMAGDSAPLVEVHTLGERGLHYRHRLGRGVSNWMHLNALPAPRLTDACGSGDWCTAGLISKIGGSGVDGLRSAGARGVREALRYGQALAAVNCSFEGARGAMYATPKKSFESRIDDFLNGQLDSVNEIPVESSANQVVPCPSCPPTSAN